mmetsp:Transcript_4275/g.11146  ORF Transcript_4275/g.11146 Transcript_4275/m.11146 type:complete len:234 (-) Transcript_4275:2954-3655(-)
MIGTLDPASIAGGDGGGEVLVTRGAAESIDADAATADAEPGGGSATGSGHDAGPVRRRGLQRSGLPSEVLVVLGCSRDELSPLLCERSRSSKTDFLDFIAAFDILTALLASPAAAGAVTAPFSLPPPKRLLNQPAIPSTGAAPSRRGDPGSSSLLPPRPLRAWRARWVASRLALAALLEASRLMAAAASSASSFLSFSRAASCAALVFASGMSAVLSAYVQSMSGRQRMCTEK